MEITPDEHIAKRRKMRKGTHSCWECRRRKVKCLFTLPSDIICINCSRRGASCFAQDEVVDGNYGATNEAEEQSISHIFGQYRNVVSKGESTASLSSSPNAMTIQFSPPNQRSMAQQDVAIASRLPLTPASSSVEANETSALVRATQGLLRALPSRHEVQLILEKTKNISMLCYESAYRIRNLREEDLQSVFKSLLQPESHPVLLARQMLLFAAAMRHLPPNEIVHGLSKNHYCVMEELAEAAIQHVSMNDALVGSLEGLQIIMLETFYHIDSSNIRRAWMSVHRAVMVAQLLGLPHPGHYRYKRIANDHELDARSLWLCIARADRVLSLLLGLPAGTHALGDIEQSQDFRTLCTNIAGRLLVRNDITDYDMALARTREIDREMINITQVVDANFWRPILLNGLEVNSINAFLEVQRAWDHMCYYYLILQLHLRYILCPTRGPQYLYSRIACANASREILNRQIAIRSANVISASCRLGDFISLIAGLTLILVHIVSHSHREGTDNVLAHQRMGDRAIIEGGLASLEAMAEVRIDALGAKCSTLLKELLAIEAETCRHRAQAKNTPANGETIQARMLTIKVPYVGSIQISCSGLTAIPLSKDMPEQELPEGVVVGGIGTLHITNAMVPAEVGDFIPHCETAPGASMMAPGTSFGQDDSLFPDASAPADQWVFQGADTAFFDALFKAGPDPTLNNGSGTANWDFSNFP